MESMLKTTLYISFFAFIYTFIYCEVVFAMKKASYGTKRSDTFKLCVLVPVFLIPFLILSYVTRKKTIMEKLGRAFLLITALFIVLVVIDKENDEKNIGVSMKAFLISIFIYFLFLTDIFSDFKRNETEQLKEPMSEMSA